jgi:RNA polymerase sigma factor (sigma-70 family)
MRGSRHFRRLPASFPKKTAFSIVVLMKAYGKSMIDRSKSEWIAEAMDLHEARLLRYATWLMGDLEIAREVVQETFLRLCKEQHGSKIANYLAQWLFTVCRNLAFDIRKKEARMTPLEDVHIGVDSRLDQKLDERQTAAEIFRMLDRLPKNQREVVHLKFQCDLSYKEISEITKLSVTNVGFLMHTALTKLRKELLSESVRRSQ